MVWRSGLGGDQVVAHVVQATAAEQLRKKSCKRPTVPSSARRSSGELARPAQAGTVGSAASGAKRRAQFAGTSSSTLLAGWVPTLTSTSAK